MNHKSQSFDVDTSTTTQPHSDAGLDDLSPASQRTVREPHVKIVTMTLSSASDASRIEEAIRSAHFADTHLVVDTSPDRPEVRQVAERLGPKVVVHPWAWQDDFSKARNALNAIATRCISGEELTWGVVLDSDERLVCPNAQATRLELELAEFNTGMAYDTTDFYTKERAFRLPTQAIYAGPTHEACNNSDPRGNIKTLKFWELQKTPEQHSAKIKRDVRLLRAYTKKNPCEPRWWYYLADTLSSLGQKMEAVEAFTQCAKLNGWDEEGAWACYRGASILLETERYKEAIALCGRGLAIHPGIAELAWIAAVASFRAGNKEKASYWARMSVAVGDHVGAQISHTRAGFRHLQALYELPYDILRFSLHSDEERAEAEREFWKAKFHRYGGTAEEIALQRGGNPAAQWEARNDIGRRVKALPDLLTASIFQIPNPSENYRAMNPSICLHRGRLITTIRTVNYLIDDRGTYVIPPADKNVVKTENYLADVSEDDFSLSNVRPIVDTTGGERFPTLVRGYEDLRLISFQDKLFASATVRDHAPNMPCDITITELTEDGHIVRDNVQASPKRCNEKNWMPFIHDGQLRFIYSLDPTVTLRFDPDSGTCHDSSRAATKLALDHLKGGSHAVAIPDRGWLVVVHETCTLDDKRRYFHRFVRLNETFEITHLSHAWSIRPQLGIEFIAGMLLHGGKLIMSAGLDDREACFVIADLEEALQLASAIHA